MDFISLFLFVRDCRQHNEIFQSKVKSAVFRKFFHSKISIINKFCGFRQLISFSTEFKYQRSNFSILKIKFAVFKQLFLFKKISIIFHEKSNPQSFFDNYFI